MKRNYKIYQYFENDSLNGKISKIVKFNSKNQKTYEETNDYNFSKLTSISDYNATYFYKGFLLDKIETTYPNSVSRFLEKFKYNHKNKLICSISKSYEKRLKKNRKNDSDLISEEDYETKPSWKIDSKTNYKYDENGNLIETSIPTKFNKSQNVYRYTYYDENPIKISSYENERLIWDEFRQYINKTDYNFIRIWLDGDFNIIDTCKNFGKVSFKFDSRNRIEEISEPDITGIPGNVTTKFFYNSNGLIKKIEKYNTKNEIELTNVYIYD